MRVVLASYAKDPVVLGCVMQPMPLMVISVPTITPVLSRAGYEPVWFGILVVILIETAIWLPNYVK